MLNWLKGLWNKLPFKYKFTIRYYHEQFLDEDDMSAKERRRLRIKNMTTVVKPRDLHFRCPYCGQAHEMYLRQGIRITQNHACEYAVAMWLNGTPVPFPSDQWNDMQYDYIDDPRQNITCTECGEHDFFWKWNLAFYNPLTFFEMDHEHLCHCGGEMYMEHLPGTDQYALRCERDTCRWVKPDSKVSGAPGGTPSGAEQEGELQYELRTYRERSAD